MKKGLNRKQYVKLNHEMYNNLVDSLHDLTGSLQHTFGSRLNYYCYLLATMRATLDFSTVADLGDNRALIFQLDTLYQKLHRMLVKADSWWAFLNFKAPFQRRENIGVIYKNLKLLRKLVDAYDVIDDIDESSAKKGGGKHASHSK